MDWMSEFGCSCDFIYFIALHFLCFVCTIKPLHYISYTGSKAATDFIITENKALNTSLQILDCEVQGLKISLAESQQRKAEQDLLLQVKTRGRSWISIESSRLLNGLHLALSILFQFEFHCFSLNFTVSV